MVISRLSKSVTKNCEVCGKTFKVYPCRLRIGQGRFCSLKCWWQSPEGKAVAAHGKTKVERTCPTCGNVFYVCPSVAQKGYGIFCSAKCRFQSPLGNPWLGRHHSEETKEKKRQSMNAYFEKVSIDERRRGPQSDETKEKRSQSMKEQWQDPECREKRLAGLAKKSQNPEYILKLSRLQKKRWQDPAFVAKVMASCAKKPTKPEKQLIEILGKHFPQYEYNGDFRLGITLGGSIPDFVNTNGKKEVIEVFGDYFHSPEVIGDRWKSSELGKIMAYNSLGYRCLILWEHDLKEKSEDEIVSKIKAFTGGRKCHR